MTPAELTSIIRAKPFRAFAMHLDNDRAVAVPTYESIAFGGGRIAAVVRPDDGFDILDLNEITHITLRNISPPESSISL